MKSKKLLLIICGAAWSLFLTSCGNSHSLSLDVDKEGKVKQKVGSTVFRIPKQYIVTPFPWLPKKGLDVSRSLQLLIPMEDILSEPIGHNESLSVTISPASGRSMHEWLPLTQDAWLGRGRFKKGAIEEDPKTGLVYVHSHDDIHFSVFTRRPDPGLDGRKYWLADCITWSSSDIKCASLVRTGDIWVKLFMPVNEPARMADYRNMVKQLVESWMVDDSAPAEE
ncbi:MAG: hypothetical protein D6694_13280 [Gammaproteobacteria bacterium]|nr:MAG: hypothetical protein D6694_13280 [Gammaproteobacteria bacterium]